MIGREISTSKYTPPHSGEIRNLLNKYLKE